MPSSSGTVRAQAVWDSWKERLVVVTIDHTLEVGGSLFHFCPRWLMIPVPSPGRWQQAGLRVPFTSWLRDSLTSGPPLPWGLWKVFRLLAR